ncbi:hypothetical protein JXI42_13470 [bacterium]|nr:hypothetical protein [bacterium]
MKSTDYKTKKKSIVKVSRLMLVVMILGLVFLMNQSCFRSDEDSALKYDVMLETPIEGGGIRAHLWVADTLHKVEAMTIAMSLLDKYDEFLIYDSRDAFEHRLDPEYPDYEFYQHLWIMRKKGERPQWVRIEK